jgi:hypothetical protein
MTITEQARERLAQSQPELEYQGFKLRLRYAPLILWTQNGRIPQWLSTLFAQHAQEENPTYIEEPVLTDAELAAWQKFKQDVIEYACVEPLVSFSGAPERFAADEIEGAAPGILEFVFAFATRQLKQEGVLSVASLETFRDDRAGQSESVGAGVHRAELWAEAVGVGVGH